MGGCLADAGILSVGQTCSLKCRDVRCVRVYCSITNQTNSIHTRTTYANTRTQGYKATNEAFRSDNVQTLTCDSNQQYTSQPSCVPNVCSPFYFQVGMTSATGNGCTNGTKLVTNVVNATSQKASCFVQCSSGYRATLSGAFGGRVFCPSTSEEGAQVQYTYQCT